MGELILTVGKIDVIFLFSLLVLKQIVSPQHRWCIPVCRAAFVATKEQIRFEMCYLQGSVKIDSSLLVSD